MNERTKKQHSVAIFRPSDGSAPKEIRYRMVDAIPKITRRRHWNNPHAAKATASAS